MQAIFYHGGWIKSTSCYSFMQITSLDDSPSEDVLRSSLHNSPAPVQQKFLKDLAFNVVDTYIMNEANLNDLKEKLQKERSIDVRLSIY